MGAGVRGFGLVALGGNIGVRGSGLAALVGNMGDCFWGWIYGGRFWFE